MTPRRSLPELDESVPTTGDRGFDALLVAGPVVVAAVVAFGRGPATTALAGAYVAGFVAYVLAKGAGLASGRGDRS